MKHFYPKVLVCAPQYDGKNYCFDLWSDAVNNLTYPNKDVFLADNSKTKKNVTLIKSKGFKSKWIKPHADSRVRLAKSHNACLEFFRKGSYDYMLHLETDVIPPLDVIERLLNCKKKVVCATYDIGLGDDREVMIQTDEPINRFVHNFRVTQNIKANEPLFCDGTVKKIFHGGLGCVLIEKGVFDHIDFEAYEDINVHPDSIFATRLFEQKIPVFVDTSIICDHFNQSWITI